MLIRDSHALLSFIEAIGVPPYLAIDTEFLTDNSFYPQLCLVQIAYGEHAAAIDPLNDIDLTPLIELLQNPDIVKVMHSAEQDLGIFWQQFQLSPAPLFDTQIAAMVCGFGNQIGYGQLVKAVSGVDLDKSMQSVDWSRRPLQDRHLDYALADVTYLGPVYEHLRQEVEQRERMPWIEGEIQDLLAPSRYEKDPEILWRKLRLKSPTPRRLAVLRELYLWREEQAISQNRPRGWVLKDNALREIAANPPRNANGLKQVRGIGGRADGLVKRGILRCIRKAQDLPLEECPAVESIYIPDQANENTVALLKALLQHVCEREEVAPKLLATKSELEHIALGQTARAMKDWRWTIFGKLAHDLLVGEIALKLGREGGIEIVELGS